MTRTFNIKADMEVHDGHCWEYEREAEVIVTAENKILPTAAKKILEAVYPGKGFTEIQINEV